MVGEDIVKEVLVYLKRNGPTNTFRLARKIGIERHKLLDILRKLEEKQAIRLEYGNAIFIKFISQEKHKPAKTKKPSLKPEKNLKKVKSKVKRKPAKPKALQLLQTENKQLREKLVESEETIKELEKKASAPPKVITRTIIKKIPVTKTIIKKVPVTKTVVKKILVHPPERKKETKGKRFKFPKFKFMEGIKKLKTPEFVIYGGKKNGKDNN